MVRCPVIDLVGESAGGLPVCPPIGASVVAVCPVDGPVVRSVVRSLVRSVIRSVIRSVVWATPCNGRPASDAWRSVAQVADFGFRTVWLRWCCAGVAVVRSVVPVDMARSMVRRSGWRSGRLSGQWSGRWSGLWSGGWSSLWSGSVETRPAPYNDLPKTSCGSPSKAFPPSFTGIRTHHAFPRSIASF